MANIVQSKMFNQFILKRNVSIIIDILTIVVWGPN